MGRANPHSFCTKWVEMSDAMTDEQHAAEDAKMAEAKARTRFLNEHPEVAAAEAKKRDTAPMYRDNKPFSPFKS